ncbi:hypothetical protein [Alkalicoccobacillus murimartini]|uniref:Uncharacterized protein n=1 Tax=Alkalicoccobacillus murimartini TaxID=171685 RepID=A0ABT9YM98_9BACI|nr:hypothetical protein [Alkalicoccobacillus murimartini]MDQ0208621.1 hypothetical protein [Alkalicoccobacillus murimartini]
MNKTLTYSTFLLLSFGLIGCNQLQNEVEELEQEYGIEIHIDDIGDRDLQTIAKLDRDQIETMLSYVRKFKEEEQKEGHTRHYLASSLLEAIRTDDEEEIPVDGYSLYLGTQGDEVDAINLMTTVYFYSDRAAMEVASMDATKIGRGGISWQNSEERVIEASEEQAEFYIEGEWVGEFIYEGKVLSFTEPNAWTFILTEEDVERYEQEAINIDAVS